MLTVNEAFAKFKRRLEITTAEEQDASRRQRRIREVIAGRFCVVDDFLTGSYRRHTKTKPLKDVDIFSVLGGDDANYRRRPPGVVLEEYRRALAEEYGERRVEVQRRSVRVDFGVASVDDLSNRVVSFDIAPAFQQDDHYVIPDRITGDWMATNPRVHAAKATDANQQCGGHWKPLVKMIKKWNDHHDRPIRPSFLIEVMSLDLLTVWGGSYPREAKAWFATAIGAIDETWHDPAGLGHPVSDRLDQEFFRRETARNALIEAEATCTEAITEEMAGRTGRALDRWQSLFGPTFVKS